MIRFNMKHNSYYLARFFRPSRLPAVILVILFPSRWSSEREVGRPDNPQDDDYRHEQSDDLSLPLEACMTLWNHSYLETDS